MAHIDTLVSDKTGTLTEGRFKVSEVMPESGYTADDVVRYAAAVESGSTHPIGAAIAAACSDPVPQSEITGEENHAGKGIIAIAGHTPTPYLDEIADHPDRPGVGEGGLGQMVRVGAGDETGGVADRWDIDCGCAGGYGFGRLLLLRLDDGEEFYEPVREGE